MNRASDRPDLKGVLGMCEYDVLKSGTGEDMVRIPYAMAYVRVQTWEKTMCAEEALNSGTAFSSLVMPFTGRRAKA